MIFYRVQRSPMNSRDTVHVNSAEWINSPGTGHFKKWTVPNELISELYKSHTNNKLSFNIIKHVCTVCFKS
jgi:hypothetical protein